MNEGETSIRVKVNALVADAVCDFSSQDLPNKFAVQASDYIQPSTVNRCNQQNQIKSSILL